LLGLPPSNPPCWPALYRYTAKGGEPGAGGSMTPGGSMAQTPIEIVPYLSPPLDDDSKKKGGEKQTGSSFVVVVEGVGVVGVVVSSFV